MKRMSRKRFIKLLMAQGVSRNEANDLARIVGLINGGGLLQ